MKKTTHPGERTTDRAQNKGRTEPFTNTTNDIPKTELPSPAESYHTVALMSATSGLRKRRHTHTWDPQPGDAVRAKFKADKAPPRFTSRWEGQGSWFPGMIAGVHGDGAVDVMFNDGFFESRVLLTNVQRVGHRVLRQWRTSGHALIGARLRIGAVSATVMCWCPASPAASEHEWAEAFQCVHDDDDEEMLTRTQVEDAIQRFGAPSSSLSPPPLPPPPSGPGALGSTDPAALRVARFPSWASDAATAVPAAPAAAEGIAGVREVRRLKPPYLNLTLTYLTSQT